METKKFMNVETFRQNGKFLGYVFTTQEREEVAIIVKESQGDIIATEVDVLSIANCERITMMDETETWRWRLSAEVLHTLFIHFCPQGTEEDKNVFLYGDEGHVMNEENRWKSKHYFFSDEITNDLFDRIGKWDEVIEQAAEDPDNRNYYEFLINAGKRKFKICVVDDDYSARLCYFEELKKESA